MLAVGYHFEAKTFSLGSQYYKGVILALLACSQLSIAFWTFQYDKSEPRRFPRFFLLSVAFYLSD